MPVSSVSEQNILQIGICDDEPLAVDYLTLHLTKWAKETGHPLHISTFFSAEQFLFEYEANQNYDILLLDIQMGEMNGMELARRIREQNETVQLVFITALADYISEGYEVSALHYLLKPVSAEKLFSVMNRAVQDRRQTEPYVLLAADQTTRRIALNSILCVEAFSHNLVITTQEERIELRETIGSLADKLGSSFVRPHRSYLVNLRHIHSITKSEILLDNGILVPLSRYNYQKINQAFLEYYRGQLIHGTI